MRLLVVTAVESERGAFLAGAAREDLFVRAAREDLFVRAAREDVFAGAAEAARVDVIAAGVGPAAAAAGTARALALAEAAGQPYGAVLSAGIAGGFAGRVGVGGTALARYSVAADLGATAPAGFLSLDELGFGSATISADPTLLAELRAALPDAVVGTMLTVTTVTGTAEGSAALLARHPDAVCEAMEGFGVATAAAQAGIPFAELRTISNLVGPRDRGSWRIAEALSALSAASAAVLAGR